MRNNQEKSIACSDASLYDVRVHTDEDRNQHKDCILGNHRCIFAN